MNVIRELDEIQFKIATIGVYGFNETEFFETLQKAKIDVFCDIRLHRGMRGRSILLSIARDYKTDCRSWAYITSI